VAVFDDAVLMLRRWRDRGLKRAVVSSSKNCRKVLQLAGLTDLFDVRVDGVTAERLHLKGKPEPDIFLHAARDLGVAPSRAVVFEDAVAGVQAGRAGGFAWVVGVARQGQGQPLLDNGADVVVQRPGRTGPRRRRRMTGKKWPELPSALESMEEIKRGLNGQQPALFLDYDGTLTPIVPRPEDAVLGQDMRALLQALASLCTVAVVSGRDRADVEKLVGLENLVYAGSHGFDISGPRGLHFEHEGGRKPCRSWTRRKPHSGNAWRRSRASRWSANASPLRFITAMRLTMISPLSKKPLRK
jgi:hypothetical protein